MELWARIKGKEYPVSNGASLTDEFSDTLDSGSVVLSHIKGEIDLKPYDDVIIHLGKCPDRPIKNGVIKQLDYSDDGHTVGGVFYWHMLCWSYSREQVELQDDAEFYTYRISLISETKGLEAVQLPNLSITQPMRTNENSSNAFTVYTKLYEYLELYSPYVKVTAVNTQWIWARKYQMSSGDGKIGGLYSCDYFKDVVCPEMSIYGSNLREAIARMFAVKDCIPVVRDGLIWAMPLSKRGNRFDMITPNSNVGFETMQMDGSSYSDRIRRDYTDGISSYSVTKAVEDIGFRNSQTGTMTLDSMQLELSYPIYEITKIEMRYLKKIGDTYVRVSQDITPFVIRQEKRNLLSEDWMKFSDSELMLMSETEAAKFKYMTVGYSQFSNVIGGWGQRYDEIKHKAFMNATYTKSVIENIFRYMDRRYPRGDSYVDRVTPVSDIDYVVDFGTAGDVYQSAKEPTYQIAGDSAIHQLTEYANSGEGSDPEHNPVDFTSNGISTSDVDETSDRDSKLFGALFTQLTQFVKTVTFHVEYQACISSAVVASKSEHDGNIVIRDSQSSSLPYMEEDGVALRSKVDKLGNASVTYTERIRDFALAHMLSDVRNKDNEVVYRRSFVFYPDYILVTYYLMRDYTLRNYFVSVYAKNRPFSYVGYGQTMDRKENRTVEIYLSETEEYTQPSSRQLWLSNEIDTAELMSFARPTEYSTTTWLPTFREAGWTDVAFYNRFGRQSSEDSYFVGTFLTDFQRFSTGTSICWVVSMKDSVSAGTYISRWAPHFTFSESFLSRHTDNYYMNIDTMTGSLQEWYMLRQDNADTGFIAYMEFGVGRMTSGTKTPAAAAEKARILPMSPSEIDRNGEKNIGETDKYAKDVTGIDAVQYVTGQFGDETDKIDEVVAPQFGEHGSSVYKDGSERLSVTSQLEFIAGGGVRIGPAAMRISDLAGRAEKRFDEVPVPTINQPHVEMGVLFVNKIEKQTVWNPTNLGLFPITINYENGVYFPTINICLTEDQSKNPRISVPVLTLMDKYGRMSIETYLSIMAPEQTFNNFPYIMVHAAITYKYRNSTSESWKTQAGWEISVPAFDFDAITYKDFFKRVPLLTSKAEEIEVDDSVPSVYDISKICNYISPSTFRLTPCSRKLRNYTVIWGSYIDESENEVNLLDLVSKNKFISIRPFLFEQREVNGGVYEDDIDWNIFEDGSLSRMGLKEFWNTPSDHSPVDRTSYVSRLNNLSVSSGDFNRLNMQWIGFGEYLNPEDEYRQYSDKEIDGMIGKLRLVNTPEEVTSSRIYCGIRNGKGMRIITSQEGYKSARLFYWNGKSWEFVLGANLDEDGVAYIYVSVLDDRSHSIINAATGDVSGKRQNFASKWDFDTESFGGSLKTTQYDGTGYTSGYTATWKDGNGNILQQTDCRTRSDEKYTGDNPTKEDCNFKGWKRETDQATGNVTYTAVFYPKNEHDVVWVVDGEAVKGVTTDNYDPIEYDGKTPEKAPTDAVTYMFDGWDVSMDDAGNIIYTAQFTETVRKYIVTWNNNDGTLIYSETYSYGDTPSYDASRHGTPVSKIPVGDIASSADFSGDGWYTFAQILSRMVPTGKTFSGWSPTVAKVTKDVTYTATFVDSASLPTEIPAGTFTVSSKPEGKSSSYAMLRLRKPADGTEPDLAYQSWVLVQGSSDRLYPDDTYEYDRIEGPNNIVITGSATSINTHQSPAYSRFNDTARLGRRKTPAEFYSDSGNASLIQRLHNGDWYGNITSEASIYYVYLGTDFSATDAKDMTKWAETAVPAATEAGKSLGKSTDLSKWSIKAQFTVSYNK